MSPRVPPVSRDETQSSSKSAVASTAPVAPPLTLYRAAPALMLNAGLCSEPRGTVTDERGSAQPPDPLQLKLVRVSALGWAAASRRAGRMIAPSATSGPNGNRGAEAMVRPVGMISAGRTGR